MAANLSLTLVFVIFTTLSLSDSLVSSSPSPPFTKSISDLKEAIVKGLGFQAEDLKVWGFDQREALVGHSVAYEFDVEVEGNQVIPFKLLEDVNRWDYVDLPIFRFKDDDSGLVGTKKTRDDGLHVLAPFQLAGPMEIWIQDAEDMRLSLPHDVDAGIVKKVELADGAVVTVNGARSVSLRHPIDLPLPLNRTRNGFASALLAIAKQLLHASRGKGAPLLSLRVVGPTSLAAPSSSSVVPSKRLKLKRLAPGLVELSSLAKLQQVDALSTIDLEEVTALLTPNHLTKMWPFVSVNASNSNLVGFEKLLASVLGPKANKKGSIRLLKANVFAQTFVKIGFGIEKKVKEGDGITWEGFPDWRTKPESVTMHFEVLAKVEGEKIVPERVMQVEPVVVEDTIAPNVLTGNVSMSRMPVVHPPVSPFTL
ncbi:hypothetical protein K2173_023985 [Erythroxylum novogranatense]|uniref:Tunicamycin induced 1 n=1 Tax=Erythroxylum novogranatense TaxID=1862640 RepID=A0AAV8TSS8_9ROSI|nr:hypothetical protein K2173_023985 [Erythroxylum novogranatense]